MKKTVLAVAMLGLTIAPVEYATAQAQAAPQSTRQVGTVKAINGKITLTTDAGAELSVVVADGARLVRTEPGQKDLTGATAITLKDIQVGDRMLVKGASPDGGKSLSASLIVLMKKTSIAEKQTREREEWQKRGTGGPVTAVDLATGDITVSASGAGATKVVKVHTTKNTIVRRYAPDSVKFDDAKVATLADVKVGDQLRARGERNADGTELTAEEVVAGTFRNIAATVISTDAAANTITVNDLATKKPVVVKVSADSQMKKLPPMMAQGMAMRLKGGAPQGNGNGPGMPANGPAAGGQFPGAGAPRNGNGFGGPGAGAGRGGDFNQMLSRLPALTIGELQKGDAVMIVSTQGNGSDVTAITLLSGVEPILTAAPNGNGSTILSPWSLGGGGEGGGEASAE